MRVKFLAIKTINRTILLLAFVLTPIESVYASNHTEDLFSRTSEMQITLAAPWRTLVRNVKVNKQYPAKLSFTTDDGTETILDVEVEPRGNSRRYVTCDFPPLKITFNPEQTSNTPFADREDIRLTTYCKKSKKYEQYAIKEFLAYRIYNILTDYSVKVRPLIINYVDSKFKGNTLNRFSYFSEDSSDVARRNGLVQLHQKTVNHKEFGPQAMALFSLFQFMIGNVDWAVTASPGDKMCCHNSSILAKENSANSKIAVPYDFDSTGLVNPYYAAPPRGLKLHSMRQRLYRGFCPYNDALPQAVEILNQKKFAILEALSNSSHLSKSNRNQNTEYIEGFYTIINDPGKFKKTILNKCRG